MQVTRVAVIGGGNGGMATAADLSLAGFEVRLYVRNAARFAETLETRRIRISGAGRRGTAEVAVVSTDLGAVLPGAEVVMVPLPGYAHAEIARASAPYLEDSQVVCLAPGTFGAYVFADAVRRAGSAARPVVAEMATLPYGARIVGPSDVTLPMVSTHLPTGAFPARRTGEAVAALRQLYPTTEPVADVLDAGLLNVNPALHPTLVLMNAGPIETQDAYDIHNEGTTPGILRVMASLEGERIALREALGYGPAHWSIMDYYAHQDWMYGPRAREQVVESEAWRERLTFDFRYLTEDVPCGLALWISLGRWLGVPTPLAEAFLAIANALNQADYYATGRTLESLDLSGTTPAALQRVLREGWT